MNTTLINALWQRIAKTELVNKVDVYITVDKMTKEQQADFEAFIAVNPENTVDVSHDYFGLRRAFIQPDSVYAQTFAPRISGYAQKQPS